MDGTRPLCMYHLLGTALTRRHVSFLQSVPAPDSRFNWRLVLPPENRRGPQLVQNTLNDKQLSKVSGIRVRRVLEF